MTLSARSIFTILLAGAAAYFIATRRALAWKASSRLEPVEPGDAIVVTGTSTGIGKHAALSLAREGYTVFAGVRRTKDGDALLESAKRFGVNVENIRPIILDVTDSEHIERAVETVTAFVGDRGLKGLFNNAGIGGDYSMIVGKSSTSVEFVPMLQYRRVFDVNVFGLIEVTKAFLPLLREGRGRIIMTSSLGGRMASPFMSAYASSKYAVEGFADSLRREMYPLGVKVSVIEPGFVITPIFTGWLPESEEPYVERERTTWKRFWKAALDAPTPKVTSEAVLHAMRAEKPKVRYIVGKDAGLMRIFASLPPTWIDYLGRYDNREEITDEEIKELLEVSKTEFPL